jgi:hypothetical protein
MIRFGAASENMRPFDREDLFFIRLRLLVVMARSLQQNNPLGHYRKRAVEENAQFIFYEALQRSTQFNNQSQNTPSPQSQSKAHQSHFIWLQRVQLLAVMVRSMVQGNPMGDFRNQALTENIQQVSERLSLPANLFQAPFLKVA